MRGGLGGLYFKFYIYRSVLALDMREKRKNSQNAPERACSLFWHKLPRPHAKTRTANSGRAKMGNSANVHFSGHGKARSTASSKVGGLVF